MPPSQKSIGAASGGIPDVSRIDGLLVATVFLALGLSILMRIAVGADQPLWLDEAGTGAVIARDSLSAFLKAVYTDVTAPLYYFLMYPWRFVAGLSDTALRLPSVVFGIVAPLVLLRGRVPGLPREEQLTWGSLLALWIPGIWYSQDARFYTLLLLLCAAQTILYTRLISAPTHRLATLWAGISALAILTHYHALLLTTLQGLAYLAFRPRKAIQSWRAALVFLVPAAWLAIHLPHVALYLQTDVAWYPVLKPGEVIGIGTYIFGDLLLFLALPLVVVVAFVSGRRARGCRQQIWLGSGPSWLAAGTAICTALIIIALGFVRPSFTARYLTPCIPGLMLGLTMALRPAARRSRLIHPVVIVLFLLVAIGWARSEMVPGAWVRGETREGERIYNYEIASDALMEAGTHRLVYLWDHPASRILPPEQLAAMGGFFFHRRGKAIMVEAVILQQGEDANARLLQAAAEPGSSILWLFDTAIQGTSATAKPPRLSDIDPAWQCRNFGISTIGVVACNRKER